MPGDFTSTESQASGSPAPPHHEHYEDHEETLDHSMSSDDASFLFGHGAASSTPLAAKSGRLAIEQDASWASSMESPFDRLDRKMREELRIGDEDVSSQPTPSLPEGYTYASSRGAGHEEEEYEEEPSVLISRRDWDVSGVPSRSGVPTATATKSKSATPKPLVQNILKANAQGSTKSPRRPHSSQNPFASAEPSTSKAIPTSNAWNGIADLRNTPLNPKIKRPSAGPGSASRIFDDDFDDSEDDLTMGLGMSPPVTMNFTLPPRNLAKTPAKEAAKLVLDHFMREVGGGGTPSPQMPTPPSFAKYGRQMASPGTGRKLFRAALEEDAAALVEDDGDVVASMAQEDSLDGAGMSAEQDQSADDIRGDETREDDTYHPGRHQAASYDQSAMSQQHHHEEADADTTDLLHLNSNTLSPTTSEAGRVFGGPSGAGRGGFNLFGPDEMQTFHGGVSGPAYTQMWPLC